MGIFGKPPDGKPVEPQLPARPPAPGPSPTASASAAPVAAAARSGPCLIGAKTVVKGEVTGDEDVLVEGVVEGQVRIARDLRVGTGGTVRAKVEAQAIVVAGELVGDCVAKGRIEIQPTGKLTGNIKAPRLIIAEGATFRGTSDMSGRKD
jgi:cytoskeletal protein CcmA (bactofilin family)